MKSLYESILDIDDNISKLDWENIDLVSILDIETQEDWDNAYFALKSKMNSESKPAKSVVDAGQIQLYYEKGAIYINFDDRYNRIGFGTWDKSWDIAFKGNRTDIYKAAFGYGRLSYNTFKPYYMPKSLLPSYKKAIKLAKK
jgi:hypothetical protein